MTQKRLAAFSLRLFVFCGMLNVGLMSAHGQRLSYEQDFSFLAGQTASVQIRVPRFLPSLGAYHQGTVQIRNLSGTQEATMHADGGAPDIFNLYYGVEVWGQMAQLGFNGVAQDQILGHSVPDDGQFHVVPRDLGPVDGPTFSTNSDWGFVGQSWLSPTNVNDHWVELYKNTLGGVEAVTENWWVRGVSNPSANGTFRVSYDFTASHPISMDELPSVIAGTRVELSNGTLQMNDGFDFDGIFRSVQSSITAAQGAIDNLGQLDFDLNSLLRVESEATLNVDAGGGISLSGQSQIRLDGKIKLKVGDITLIDSNPTAIIHVDGPGIIEMANTQLEQQGINARISTGPSGDVNVNIANGLGSIHLGQGGSVGLESGNSRITVGSDGSVQGSLILGDEELPVDLQLGGVTSPGHSPGELQVFGDLTFNSNSVTQMEIAGLLPRDEFDLISVREVDDQFGMVDLGSSKLELFVLNGFELTPDILSGSFDIILADGGVLGGFGNVVSGSRLFTEDGLGSFLVTISSDRVTLSNFTLAVPESNSCLFLAIAAGWMAGWRRRSAAAVTAMGGCS